MPRLSLTRLYTTIITPATPTIQTAPVFTPLPPPRPTKPATLRSITLGFLLGLTVAGASGFGYLVEEYQTQNKNTTRHVAKMAESVETINNTFETMNALKADIAQLKRDSASKDSLQALKQTVDRNLDTIRLDFLGAQKASQEGNPIRKLGALVSNGTKA